MTDGPFRNAKLSTHWKRYGQLLVSDAAAVEERVMHACHSLMDGVVMTDFIPLLVELKTYVELDQMDLDPVTSVETIFDGHPTSSLTDGLQKCLLSNLRNGIPAETALHQALDTTAQECLSMAKNRIDEECIVARDLGDMSRDDYRKGIDRNQETFAAIRATDISEALAAGNKRAFRPTSHKKVGVDEGPEE